MATQTPANAGDAATTANKPKKRKGRSATKLTVAEAHGIFASWRPVYSQIKRIRKAVDEGTLTRPCAAAADTLESEFGKQVKRLASAKDLTVVLRHKRIPGMSLSAPGLAQIMLEGYKVSLKDDDYELAG